MNNAHIIRIARNLNTFFGTSANYSKNYSRATEYCECIWNALGNYYFMSELKSRKLFEMTQFWRSTLSDKENLFVFH